MHNNTLLLEHYTSRVQYNLYNMYYYDYTNCILYDNLAAYNAITPLIAHSVVECKLMQ